METGMTVQHVCVYVLSVTNTIIILYGYPGTYVQTII